MSVPPPPAEVEAGTSRPRVEGEREQEILNATLTVLGEVGYDRLTMDAVATAAKASKATLYRRWNDKLSLVIDALIAHKGPVVSTDTGSLRGDLLATFCGKMGGLDDPQSVNTFSSVLTALPRDPAFAEAFRRDVVGPKNKAGKLIFERAIERGEISPASNADLLADALPGILFHRFFVLGEAPTPERIVAVIDQIILPAALHKRS